MTLLSALLTAALTLSSAPGPVGLEDEVDHLAVASVLMRDGHYERAHKELDALDMGAPQTDRTRAETLRGMIYLRQGDHAKAAVALEAALRYGTSAKPPEADGGVASADTQPSPLVWAFLAQARFALEDYRGALKALDGADSAGAKLAGVWLLRVQCHWRLNELERAHAALLAGQQRHPDVQELFRQEIFLLVDLKLYQSALEKGRAYLKSANEAGPDDYAAIAEALRKAKAFDSAARLLEEARLRFDAHPTLVRQLGRVYLDMERPATAARIFERAARRDPSFALEAAELYRRAGDTIRALGINAISNDTPGKTRQRLGLLIELSRFAEATGLEKRLARLGILKEDALVYGLAYAHFQLGNFRAAERLLKRIADPSVFERATHLRQAMATCRNEGWTCL
jgi:tetratricopeptide (TPR) repeat protein